MPHLNIFRWQTGRGWLVLSGGGAWDSEAVQTIEAAVLGRTISQGPLVYIWAASDLETADQHMDWLRDLGARTGYLLDIVSESDQELLERLGEAGVIIVGDGPNQGALRDALDGAVLEGLRLAFSRGATIYAVGLSAEPFGALHLGSTSLTPGIAWLQHAILIAGYTPEMADELHELIRQTPEHFGIGLGQGAALALGPRGEVEVWGNPAVTVSLGREFASAYTEGA
jgi:hypothetical protein